MSEKLTLKWGSLKAWTLNKDGPAFAALKRYMESGDVQASAMLQRDTPEQKQAIYDLIDALDAETIYNDWDDKDMTKEEAKAYVRDYGAGK